MNTISEINILPKDFTFMKYGLEVRLVNEDDSEFILSLRADPKKTKYMKTLDNNIETQREWIREYKKRERKGLDYYLIYMNSDYKPIGLNRISHINYIEKIAKASSWITIDGLVNEAYKMSSIHSEIAFNILNLDKLIFEVHKDNKQLIKAYKNLDHTPFDYESDFINYSVSKDEFMKAYNTDTAKLLLQKESS